MIRPLAMLLAAAAVGGLAGCETPPYHGEVGVHGRDYDVRVVFSDADRRIIRDYYRSDYRALPPGLAKQGKVPPGHARRLYPRQPLPPDVVWQHLPAHVERQLSRLPEGYARIVIGASVAILHTRTRIVLDVIDDLHD